MSPSAPKIFRAMQPDGTGPKVGRTRRCLGVVVGPPPTGDIDVDGAGAVHPTTGGMSVSPSWTELPAWRVPKRLAAKIRGAAGNDGDRVYSHGSSSFTDGHVAPGLFLRVDRPGHGNVEPSATCSLASFEAGLSGTRAAWIVDEP